jgi:hypothetical protein
MQVPILGLAFLIMLTLKLLGATSLSWWAVTAPLWGGWLVFLFSYVLMWGIVYLLFK